jgi:hypothetical protein
LTQNVQDSLVGNLVNSENSRAFADPTISVRATEPMDHAGTLVSPIAPVSSGNETTMVAQHLGGFSNELSASEVMTTGNSLALSKPEDAIERAEEILHSESVIRESWSGSNDLVFHGNYGDDAHGHANLNWSDALDGDKGTAMLAVGIDWLHSVDSSSPVSIDQMNHFNDPGRHANCDGHVADAGNVNVDEIHRIM